MTTVSIHPNFDPRYQGFYWEGLQRLGFRPRLSTKGFPVPDEPGFLDGKDGLAALVRTPTGVKRLYISADDHATVRGPELEWADRLGKVNLPPVASPGDADERILPLGPSFGVRAWDLRRSATTALASRRMMPGRSGRGRAQLFFEQYRTRLPESRYRPGSSDADYIFFAAWPWTRHPEVNPPRAEFIRACGRQAGLRFEGGFVPRRRGNPRELAGLYAPRRYPLGSYLDRVGRSAVAFNNPAVHGCLGWKLGEFLALGKAIVTLPLGRRLPAPLEHGVHVHVVDGSAAGLDDAIGRLRVDHRYRLRLEAGARAYYDAWVRPEVAVGRLLEGWGALPDG